MQHDGVAMGSPLGVLLADAYISHIESIVLDDGTMKPSIYCRYVDDIFVCAPNIQFTHRLKQRLQELSGLNLTIEPSNNNMIQFLDSLVTLQGASFNTSVYRKPTDSNKCLNGKSECMQDYKNSVVSAYVHRALKVCSTWQQLHSELQHVRQMIVDNGYSNTTFDEVCNSAMAKYIEGVTANNQLETIKLFYQKIFTDAYRMDEAVIKNLIYNNFSPVNDSYKIRLSVYYTNPKSFNYVTIGII